MLVVLARNAGSVVATTVSEQGAPQEKVVLGPGAVPEFVGQREPQHPRWVWDSTSRWYPELLAARVRVERCVDLRLCHRILRSSALTSGSALARAEDNGWDAAAPAVVGQEPGGTLFELDQASEKPEPDPVEEFRLQREAVAATAEPGRIGRLLAVESAGSLVAAEMSFAGLPWRADVHDEILTAVLGKRPAEGERPPKLQVLLEEIRHLLEAPELNPDSQTELVRALANAGLLATSTRSRELRELDHPAIAPLLEYKKLARLLSANGWHWLETWVHEGRFRPVYVPGGVVTGRWASDGGGALQLPRHVRAAVKADPGWMLVVADASQLEPRVLAGMSGDRAMTRAAAEDLYEGVVASGVVETREQAKIALLGAMYGSTTGESARLMPKLARAYPDAIGLVERAARAGERGEVVTTTLGRSSLPPDAAWRRVQAGAYAETATDAEQRRARGQARAWGRFTRNFIVQGSAAEWALCWMATLRIRLHAMGEGAWITDSPHLVFFLHDEVVVHCPASLADRVAEEMRDAAAEASRLLFGALPVSIPVSIAIVEDYGQAK